jgi:hypothetical protein
MENQTRFDLNATLENWRQELASQPTLTAENRRELETHLRDTLSEFQSRGLNENESFWLARRRVGQLKQISEEFLKADPIAVWRERALWMALGYGSLQFWSFLACVIPLHHWTNGFAGLLSGYGWLLVLYLPVICLVILLAKGKLGKACDVLAKVFNSRRRFVAAALIFLGSVQGSQMLINYKYRTQMNLERWMNGFWMSMFTQIFWPLMLIALITWLLPAQNRKTLKRG